MTNKNKYKSRIEVPDSYGVMVQNLEKYVKEKIALQFIEVIQEKMTIKTELSYRNMSRLYEGTVVILTEHEYERLVNLKHVHGLTEETKPKQDLSFDPVAYLKNRVNRI